jgi:hypothetical protein
MVYFGPSKSPWAFKSLMESNRLQVGTRSSHHIFKQQIPSKAFPQLHRTLITMATEKIYHSPYPNIDLPETSCWHFLYDNPNCPVDDKPIYVDGMTEKQVK